MKTIKFNVASIHTCTEIEGPFKRLAIWFQGCNINCKGCCNPDYQTLVPQNILSIEELTLIIEKAQTDYGIEGVTYLGGEPTLQQGLPLLTEKIRALGLGVLAFTGRNYEDAKELLTGCDVVIDGAFIEGKEDDKRKIIGSTNQRILCLTERYKDCIEEWFITDGGKSVEVNVGKRIVLNGDYIGNDLKN